MIHVAKSAGFCFGVSRSVELAEKLLKDGPCKSLGPLIHNDDVVGKLAEMGLSVVESPEQVGPGRQSADTLARGFESRGGRDARRRS